MVSLPKASRSQDQNRASLVLFVIFVLLHLTAALVTLVWFDMAGTVLTKLALVLLGVFGYMVAVFLIARMLNRLDSVDAAWGGAFIVATIASWMVGSSTSLGMTVQTLVLVLVGLWGVRLSTHIMRRLATHPEDKRYVALRRQWKDRVWSKAFFRIFLLQGLLAIVISIAVIHINFSAPQPLDGWAIAGGLIWLIGFLFEATGDRQLKRFLADPKNRGKIMDRGLWRYTRHPNYFGEVTQWWGIAVIAFATPFGWVGLLSPIVIMYLLLFVSGIPLTEKSFEGRPGWDDYKKRTSAFLPLPPHKV